MLSKIHPKPTYLPTYLPPYLPMCRCDSSDSSDSIDSSDSSDTIESSLTFKFFEVQI